MHDDRGPRSYVRTHEFLSLFEQAVKDSHDSFGFPHYLFHYVHKLIDNSIPLNSDEAFYLAGISGEEGSIGLLEDGVRTGLIESTNELGEALDSSPKNLSIVYEIYCNGRVFDKILDTALRIENYRMAVQLTFATYEFSEMSTFIPMVYAKYSKPICASFFNTFIQ